MAVISPEIIPSSLAPTSAGMAAQPQPLIVSQGLVFWLLCFNKELKEIIYPRKTGAGCYWIAAVWVWALHISLPS